MEQMTRRERIQAALKKEDVDRIPFSVWYGCPHLDQDSKAMAEEQVRLARLYDMDFIKMMPNALYCAHDFGLSLDFHCTLTQPPTVRKFGIDDIGDWGRLEPLPATYGTYGRTLLMSRYIKKALQGEDIPFIQTIFSPLTIANKLAGPRTLEDMRKAPELMHSALEAITQTLIHFVKANIEEGVSGFFCGTAVATKDQLSAAEFEEFEAAYYRRVLDSIDDDVLLKMIHVHGDNTYFEEMAAYPVNCVSWHARTCNPNIAKARKLTNKCLVGGIDEAWLAAANYEEVYDHIKEAVELGGHNGLMIAPGCTCKATTPESNFFAASLATKRLFNKQSGGKND
jgi:uroporphyrinogen decarboxylase